MEAVFLKAANPVRAHCLGISLLPLTVGHLFLLRKYCPDILDQEEIDFGNLALAAFICAHPQSKAERFLCRRDGQPRKLTGLIFRLWGRLNRRDLLIERDRFDAYRSESLEPPNYLRNLSEPLRSCQSPLELRLLVMLISDFRYSEAEALDMPIIKANALWATFGEMRGKIDFATEGQKGLFAFAARMDAMKASRVN